MIRKIKSGRDKKWVLKEEYSEAPKEVSDISDALGLCSVVARLLYNRGYKTPESAREFVYMETELLCDPFAMADADKACDRISAALRDHEKITVYGDYDVDGVTAVCTLYLYLKSLGADVGYYIPNRAGEGYGVSVQAIDNIAQNGTKLIITVDTGITANDEVIYAREKGIDFIVTDHHECRGNIPDACAVINPHRPDCTYPFKELAGVGVIFKLISAFEEKRSGDSKIECAKRIFAEYADLVAIGTIADVMPIKSENRIIVSYGLKMIENSPRPGISALMDAASGKIQRVETDDKKIQKKHKITSGYIGYTLAPRINAAGRVRSAGIAVELFLADTYDKAMFYASELCEANRERQNEENSIIEEAYAKIEKEHDFENDPVIVLDADDWHNGVIGIVSSRITEKYSLPSILISFEGCDPFVKSPYDVGKGSGRSIKGMNLVDALVHCSDRLIKFGGHELAAGLSVRRMDLDLFKKEINDYARSVFNDENMVPILEADCEIGFSDITMTLAQQLQLLEPYGVENPVPVFLMRGVTVNEIYGVSGGKHTRLTLSDGTRELSAMFFSMPPSGLDIYVGDKADLIFNIDINEWNGRKNIQLIVRDIRVAEAETLKTADEKKQFEYIWNGGAFSCDDDVIPSRDDFAAVYKVIYNSLRNGFDSMTNRSILNRVRSSGQTLGYVKLRIIIKVLNELNIVDTKELSDDCYIFKIHTRTQKTDLEKSNLLRRLRSQQRQDR